MNLMCQFDWARIGHFFGCIYEVLQLKLAYELVDSVEETELSTSGHHLVCPASAEERRIRACLPLSLPAGHPLP